MVKSGATRPLLNTNPKSLYFTIFQLCFYDVNVEFTYAPTWPTYAMYCLLFRNFESPASLCSPQKRRKTTIQWWLFSVWLLFFFFSVGYTHTLKSHHCMVVVVFLLFCGLHNEAGDSKFRKGRQYIAYVGHVGGLNILLLRLEIKSKPFLCQRIILKISSHPSRIVAYLLLWVKI